MRGTLLVDDAVTYTRFLTGEGILRGVHREGGDRQTDRQTDREMV